MLSLVSSRHYDSQSEHEQINIVAFSYCIWKSVALLDGGDTSRAEQSRTSSLVATRSRANDPEESRGISSCCVRLEHQVTLFDVVDRGAFRPLPRYLYVPLPVDEPLLPPAAGGLLPEILDGTQVLPWIWTSRCLGLEIRPAHQVVFPINSDRYPLCIGLNVRRRKAKFTLRDCGLWNLWMMAVAVVDAKALEIWIVL